MLSPESGSTARGVVSRCRVVSSHEPRAVKCPAGGEIPPHFLFRGPCSKSLFRMLRPSLFREHLLPTLTTPQLPSRTFTTRAVLRRRSPLLLFAEGTYLTYCTDEVHGRPVLAGSINRKTTNNHSQHQQAACSSPSADLPLQQFSRSPTGTAAAVVTMSAGGDPDAWLGLLKWSLAHQDGTEPSEARPISDEVRPCTYRVCTSR